MARILHTQLLLTSVMLFAAGVASAADVDVSGCVEIRNDRERLACYDKAAGRESPSATADAEFGMTPALRNDATSQPKEPDSITARVTAVRKDARDYFVLTLDNQQTWALQEASTAFNFRVGDEVRIVKGALGSYRLTRAKGGVAARAKRVG